MENPIKIDDLGVPLFLETPIHSLEPETTHFVGQSFQLVHFSNSLLGFNDCFIIHPFLFTGSLGFQEGNKREWKKS